MSSTARGPTASVRALAHLRRLFLDRSLARLCPYGTRAQAANARVSVRRSKRARGISTTSSDEGDVEKTVTGQSCCRTKARVSEKVGADLAYQAAWRTGRDWPWSAA